MFLLITADSVKIENKLTLPNDDKVVVDQITEFQIAEEENRTCNNMKNIGNPKDKRYMPSIGEDKAEVLEREYLIFNDTMGATYSQTINPLYLLIKDNLTAPLWGVISKFRYWKTELKLRIQLVCPATTFGVVVGAVTPSDRTVEYNQLGFAGFTLALTDQESIEIDMPWTMPMSAIDNTTNLTDQLYNFGALWFDMFGAYNIDGTTPSIQLYVYARLQSPIFMTPMSLTPTVSLSKNKAGKKKKCCEGEGHMLKSAAGMLFDAASDYYSKKGINGVYEDAWTFYDTTSKYYSDFFGEPEIPIQDTTSNTTETLNSTQFSMPSSETTEPKEVPTASPQVPLESKGKTGQSTTAQGTAVKQSPYGDVVTPVAERGSVTLDERLSPGVPDPRKYFRDEVRHNIYARLRRFQPIYYNNITVATPVYFVVDPIFYGDVQRNPITTANVGTFRMAEFGPLSTMFRQWRGSLEYRFQFFPSSLMSARVHLYVVPSQDSMPLGAPTLSWDKAIGVLWSKTITVRGTTETIVNIPFMRNYPWEDVGDHINSMYLICAVSSISPVTTGGLVIPFIVSIRAGKDFRFKGFCGGDTDAPAVSSKEEKKKRKICKAEGHGKFGTSEAEITYMGGCEPKPLHDEEAAIGDVYAIAQRYGSNPLPSRDSFWMTVASYNYATFINMPPLIKMAQMYRLWSGQIDRKLRLSGGDQPIIYMDNRLTLYGATAGQYVARGSAVQDLSLWSIMDVRIPFYYRYDFCYCGPMGSRDYTVVGSIAPLPPNIASLGSTSPTTEVSLVKAGKDFSFYTSVGLSAFFNPLVNLRNSIYVVTPP
jgi:hypothetical protein